MELSGKIFRMVQNIVLARDFFRIKMILPGIFPGASVKHASHGFKEFWPRDVPWLPVGSFYKNLVWVEDYEYLFIPEALGFPMV